MLDFNIDEPKSYHGSEIYLTALLSFDRIPVTRRPTRGIATSASHLDRI